MQIKSFKELAAAASAMPVKTVVAVVEAHDNHTLEAVIEAKKDGIIEGMLIGNEEKIKEILTANGADPADYQIIGTNALEESLQVAVENINAGKATAIMKGKLETGQFMKAIVNKQNGLLSGGLLSLVGLYEHANYHKLLAVTDQGLNTYPDLNGKKNLIINAVGLLKKLGVEEPKVAVLAAVEKVNPKMPESVDGAELKKMNQEGEITGCIVEGPISFDLAVKQGAAAIKGYESPVAGDADVLVVPDIAAGNILVKCMTDYAGAMTAGTILGAKVPVIVTSRSAEASDKYYSIALAAYAAGN
ncbi:MAG: bifunctional enoyl-CoA hydratase/phosphate acetyltransferase [Oscillospiraceae bacterium]|nr:bifunctional enoyl-CoA hydratase/phosphate acetyltransferase [Oscillospiraceae bacterium]MBQ9857625.1 bifunctional enoyl-CoA hydratase/phosphate acetyltransferase [Oscillospiraceae bacterium]